ncbi:hypothetical protein CGI81_12935 [Vibrio parahaemolyticus]|nr:hypothetical protein CGI81_12935 [Vibrio parahaemolyticus]
MLKVWFYELSSILVFITDIKDSMARYYVNKNQQANGDHEVHKQGCSYMPLEHNRTYLGEFASCGPAVTAAKKTYSKANGCYYCSEACHTS